MPVSGCCHSAGLFVCNEVNVRPCKVCDVPQIANYLLEELALRGVRSVAGGGEVEGITVEVRGRLPVDALHTKLGDELVDEFWLLDVERGVRVTDNCLSEVAGGRAGALRLVRFGKLSDEGIDEKCL